MTPEQRSEPFWDLAYRSCRENITQLARAHPGTWEWPVPACPGWNVRDVVAHLLEVCRLAVADVPHGIGRPPAPAPGTLLPQLLAEWEELGAAVPDVWERTPWLRRGMMLLDAFSHELDIRGALGIPAPHEHPAFADTLELATMGFTMSVTAHRLPSLYIETAGHRWSAGDGDPAATVRGASLEVFRALTGRRTLAQIRGLSWSAPPEPWLPAFAWGPFTPPTGHIEDSTEATGRRLWFLPPSLSSGVVA
ncbi:maleylpyruvate isomerase family mycothiol-dependent enzyme [Streptomyces sp. NPDC048416]|uniref:maleylpyruvate isomerase family mycothiol-dependent enzyme n=1 Tax=Streptomyces sp. NPDC048416 TaxID=3365546 RepID=UPI003721137A